MVPAKIEQMLQMHAGVKESAVVGIPDDSDGSVPAAFVAENSNTNVSEISEFIYHARDEISEIK